MVEIYMIWGRMEEKGFYYDSIGRQAVSQLEIKIP